MIRGLTGAMFAEKKGDDDAMWKELLINLMADTLPAVVTIPADVYAFGRNFAIVSSKVEDLTVEFAPTVWNISTAAQGFVYNCSKLKHFRLPNATLIGYPSVVQGSINNLTDLYIPKVVRFDNQQNTFYNYGGAHLRVHCGDRTCDQIQQITNFPGTNNDTIKSKLEFVGTDGSLTWNGSAWVKS